MVRDKILEFMTKINNVCLDRYCIVPKVLTCLKYVAFQTEFENMKYFLLNYAYHVRNGNRPMPF